VDPREDHEGFMALYTRALCGFGSVV